MACSKLQPATYVEEMLTCSVCLELVTEPRTLMQCLHNYCKECLQQLMKTQKNNKPGVSCPICRRFCEEKDIRSNHFVNDLLSQHKSSLESHKTTKQCEQCPRDKPPAPAGWKCLDCRFHLCDGCKSTHLLIPLLKGHRILELSEETEFFIDHLVFCSIHSDEPIKFYCKQCKESICITCQIVNHKVHDIVTVDNALATMVPDIHKDLTTLDKKSGDLDETVQALEVEKGKVVQTYSQCKQDVNAATEEKIKKLRWEEERLTDELTKEEQTQVTSIHKKKDELISKQKEISNLKSVTRASLERARHASLLGELVNGGLCRRLREVAEEPETSQSLCVKKPTLKMNTGHQASLEEVGLLGEITYNTDTVLDGVTGAIGTTTGLSRYWSGSLTEFFKKPLKETLQIVLPYYCIHVTVCDGKLWVPTDQHNVVHSYTGEGKLVKSVQVKGSPTCVEKTSTAEMLVTCAEGGLFVLLEHSDKAVKIADGTYSDMCICGDSVYIWDHRKKQIIEFVKKDRDWRQHSVIYVGCVRNTHPWDTLLVRQGTGDRANTQFLVCACSDHTVYQVNSQGDKVRQFGSQSEQGDGALHYPLLCGIDSHDDILVADHGHSKYKLLNTVSGNWRTVFTGYSNVHGATMEGENTVWLFRNTGSQLVITKLEVNM